MCFAQLEISWIVKDDANHICMILVLNTLWMFRKNICKQSLRGLNPNVMRFINYGNIVDLLPRIILCHSNLNDIRMVKSPDFFYKTPLLWSQCILHFREASFQINNKLQIKVKASYHYSNQIPDYNFKKKMQQVHIGHYILGKTIGAGGFAKVKEARHDLTGIKVAVKIINKKKMKNKNMNSKVKRQIKILKFINHPNIIKLYQVLDTTNDIFVIMQLASKGQLYNFIQNNEITEDQAKFYFRQIIAGVEYVHQNLISHRDLKPENILIDSNNLIKIGDFGLSNLMKDGKLLKTACGSPNYAAPEIVGQRKYEGTSVDIWSCGVILYALLVGSLPFDEENIVLLYKKIQKGIYMMPERLSPAAKDLISKMLQVDPSKRIKIYDIKNHPWLRTHVPIYYRTGGSFFTQKQQQFELDYPIFNQIKKLNFQNLIEYSEQKIIKSINKREDQSFVIAYELLKDQKDRKLFAEENNLKRDETNVITIFQHVENIIVPIEKGDDEKTYIYGKVYEKQPKIIAETIIQVLKILRIQYYVKSAQYCIKCVLNTNHHTRRKSLQHSSYHHKQTEMVSQKTNTFTKPHHEQKQHRFTKRQIKFNIQIYALQKKGMGHVIDLQLTQGHPFVFFPFVRRFYAHVDQMIK